RLAKNDELRTANARAIESYDELNPYEVYEEKNGLLFYSHAGGEIAFFDTARLRWVNTERKLGGFQELIMTMYENCPHTFTESSYSKTQPAPKVDHSPRSSADQPNPINATNTASSPSVAASPNQPEKKPVASKPKIDPSRFRRLIRT